MELYLHIPFCVKKCSYCDFLSAPADETVRSAYVTRLREEIRFYGEQYRDRTVSSIFFGGGTPSVLNGTQIRLLMQAVRTVFHVEQDAEITLECNPGTVDQEKAEAYAASGINRISLGLQSANDAELVLLGRIHRYSDFLESYEILRRAGIQNMNVDLMSALPGQTVASWKATLDKLMALRPEHISAYSLMIEEGTPFYDLYAAEDERRKKGEETAVLPSEEEEREMYDLTESILSRRGYERYEISNYARAGKECRHNIGYWTGEEYLGLGLGASSYMDHVRFSNTSSLEDYLHRQFHRVDVINVDRKAQMEEYMFLGLRMMRGVTRNEFKERFGVVIDAVYGDVIARLHREGLLQLSEGRISLTKRGIDVSNMVLAEFLL